jgi:hypothetical protein
MGSHALQVYPRLAAQIVRYIAIWSQTEIELGGVLALVLRLEQATAFAAVQMYLRLTSADARRSVLDAAAQSMLAEVDYGLFSLVMKALRPIRARRNDFAHGYWGLTPELENALLWVGADDYIAYNAVMSGAVPQNPGFLGSQTMLGAAADAWQRHKDSIMVYRQADLENEVEQAEQGALAVHALIGALHPYEKERDAKRQGLLNLRLIQAVSQSANSYADTRLPQPSQPQ